MQWAQEGEVENGWRSGELQDKNRACENETGQLSISTAAGPPTAVGVNVDPKLGE